MIKKIINKIKILYIHSYLIRKIFKKYCSHSHIPFYTCDEEAFNQWVEMLRKDAVSRGMPKNLYDEVIEKVRKDWKIDKDKVIK